MADWRVVRGRVERFAALYRGPKFMALLCDPPYEMGFMGKSWDATGIAFQPETWAALSDLLLPGAFLMAFASSRGWHRLACAIEDAGFVIQPSIFDWRTNGVLDVPGLLGWSNSQAFPKATRISRQLDDKWAEENYGGWCECDDKP